MKTFIVEGDPIGAEDPYKQGRALADRMADAAGAEIDWTASRPMDGVYVLRTRKDEPDSTKRLAAYIERGNIVVRYESESDKMAAHDILLGEMKKAGVVGPARHLPATKCSGCSDPNCKLGGDGYWFAKMSGKRLDESRLCRDCKHMVGGSDIPAAEWQCDRRIDAVTGQFVLCVDERKGAAIGYPLKGESHETWECAPIGRHWEAS